MKQIPSFLIIMGAALGCMDVNLLDNMVLRDNDTDSSELSGEVQTFSTGPPAADTDDLFAPGLETRCVAPEMQSDGACILEGPASVLVRISTDELAVLDVEANIAVRLSDNWVFEHEVILKKENAARTAVIGVSDVNGNQQTLVVNVGVVKNPTIVITEVMADCVGTEPDCEYVKVMNVGTEDADLSGWMIDDNGDRNGDIIGSDGNGVILGAGTTATVAMDGFETLVDPLIPLSSSIGTGGLKNSASETIQLYTPDGVLIDEYINERMTPREGVPVVRRHRYLMRGATDLWFQPR
jgi:hypothetical protein